jgi:hypothetical protein
LSLTQPPVRWDPGYQARLNAEHDRRDRLNRKTNADIELVKESLILRSPNGARWKITVSNLGAISATAL